MNITKNTLFLSFVAFALVGVGAGVAQASEVVGEISSSGGGSGAVVVVAPIASPDAGAYTDTQSVTLAATNADEIRYFFNTTNLDSELTCSGSEPTVGNTVTVDGSGLLRAIACYSGNASSIVSFTYVIESSSSPGSSGGGGGGGSAPATTSSPTLDFNTDSSVDILDFNTMMVNWGATGATNAQGDTDGDGDVDIFDFNNFIANWQS